MTMGGIDGDQVDTRSNQRFDPLFPIRTDAHRGADAQPAALVFRGVGKLNLLFDVLDRDQALELKAVVNDQKFFDAVLVQQFFRLIETHARFYCH